MKTPSLTGDEASLSKFCMVEPGFGLYSKRSSVGLETEVSYLAVVCTDTRYVRPGSTATVCKSSNGVLEDVLRPTRKPEQSTGKAV